MDQLGIWSPQTTTFPLTTTADTTRLFTLLMTRRQFDDGVKRPISLVIRIHAFLLALTGAVSR